jgi:hypothetical protein
MNVSNMHLAREAGEKWYRQADGKHSSGDTSLE